MGACSGKKKTSKQDQVLKEAFDKVDKDHSGFIEKDELEQLLKDIAKDLGATLPKQDEIDEAMKIIDINKDGKINFQEYKKFVQTALKEQDAK